MTHHESAPSPAPSCTCGAVEYGGAQHLAPCPLRVNPPEQDGAR